MTAASDDARAFKEFVAHAFALPCRLFGLEVSDEHHVADMARKAEADEGDYETITIENVFLDETADMPWPENTGPD